MLVRGFLSSQSGKDEAASQLSIVPVVATDRWLLGRCWSRRPGRTVRPDARSAGGYPGNGSLAEVSSTPGPFGLARRSLRA